MIVMAGIMIVFDESHNDYRGNDDLGSNDSEYDDIYINIGSIIDRNNDDSCCNMILVLDYGSDYSGRKTVAFI